MTDDSIRADVWLWAARFFKTRADAAEAIGGGKVLIGDARIKRAKPLRIGDRLRIRKGPYDFYVTVRALSARRLGAEAAAVLYEEDVEGKKARVQLAEQLRIAPSLTYEGKGRPTKRERRELDRLKGESEP
ncbi:MAG TPA: RNA-binding S4 domain-containing protein [Gemmatimonadales bacterium]|nr:RNA-binding S4 domain-containing protein [Gemmatimonadales bacterium]